MCLSNIIVIFALLLLLLIIYYEIYTTIEKFTTNNKNILIDLTELPINTTIGSIINIPYIDLNKVNKDTLSNLALLDGRITGYEMLEDKSGDIKYRLLTGNTEKKIDLSSNEYKNIIKSRTFIYKDNEKLTNDPSNVYIAYPHKLPKDFIASNMTKKIPINQLNFNINNIGDLIHNLGKDCSKDNNCRGYYIALNNKNELIVTNIIDNIYETELRDYPYTMNGDILTTILCIKQTPDKIKLANSMIGACSKLTLKSKNIGLDCFGQLWKENKCDGPLPEYSDTFKALSYEELVTEIKDSNCYTNPTWKRKQKLEEKKEVNKENNISSNIMSRLEGLFK
jgi:hypothetical protein